MRRLPILGNTPQIRASHLSSASTADRHLTDRAPTIPQVYPDEPPKDFVVADGGIWRRTGYCNRCGDCCAGEDPFNGAEGSPRYRDYCALFDVVDGVGTCTKHEASNTYWLNGCSHQPSNPFAYISERCSYQWERVG